MPVISLKNSILFLKIKLTMGQFYTWVITSFVYHNLDYSVLVTDSTFRQAFAHDSRPGAVRPFDRLPPLPANSLQSDRRHSAQGDPPCAGRAQT